MEEQQMVDEISQKKSRQRKKLLYNSIRQQMEFYFSDANLTKDRFMSQLIKDDPCVDLSVFLGFNKIRRLTDKLSDICKAVSKSEILELSEDNTKVFRKTKIKYKENADDCMIYVERLPVDTEHDWLRSLFEKFGPIDYVSIPKYAHKKMIKGFAFIEYATPEGAQKALEYFESIGCKLSTTMLPEQLISISTFEQDTNEHTNNEDNLKTNPETGEFRTKEPKTDEETKIEQKENESQKKKQKHKIDDQKEDAVKTKEDKIEEEDPPSTKKRKISNDEVEDKTNEQQEKKKIKVKVGQEDTQMNEDKNTDTNEEMKLDENNVEIKGENGEKKKRKRKKYHKISNDLEQYGFQILSKKEWKQLRNKYLNLQKEKRKILKDHLNKRRFANNYFEKEELSEPRFQYTPGTIVHIELESLVDIKIKNDIRSQAGFQYVDIPPGNTEGYVRFSDNDSAKKFLESGFKAKLRILEGDEEKNYWNKIAETREKKFQKSANKKMRGRDKLMRRAEKELGKHIRFDNTD